jgi:hypothetical protein
MNLQKNIALVIFAVPVFCFGNGRFQGKSQNQDFNISFDETFNEIQGHWGNLAYNLTVDPTFFEVQGTAANQPVNMSFDKTFKNVSGTTPCGKIDLSYDLVFKEVEGSVCGQKMHVSLANADEVLPMYTDVSLTTVLDTFPVQLRTQVRRFILKRLPFLAP